MTMHDVIKARISELPGKIGLYYACPAKGEELCVNAELPLLAASVIKVPIMVEAFRQMEDGQLDRNMPVVIRKKDKLPSCGALTYLHDGLEVTVIDLVTLMIILSDNTATNLLIDILGVNKINATIDRLGLTGTRLNRKLFRPELSAQGIENTVSARDMGVLFRMMLDGELISPGASAEMLRILGDQRLNGKLPFFLHARDIDVAHKTGEDEGITHDVGVIWTELPCILCFLSNETDVAQTERAMQDVAAIVAGI